MNTANTSIFKPRMKTMKDIESVNTQPDQSELRKGQLVSENAQSNWDENEQDTGRF